MKEQYLKELEKLVNIDSGTHQVAGIKQIADFFDARYKAMGFSTQMHDLGKGGVGFEARNKPEADKIDVLLIGHMDTVFPEGTAKERPFSRDERHAYGPGVSDMKNGLLAMLYAIEHLPQEVRDSLSICVAQNPDEEIGSVYSTDWLASLAKKASFALVAESARVNGELVKARKGSAVYKVEFKGKAAHAGNDPAAGRSAIVEMAHWILAVNKMQNLDAGTSCNSGMVSGGTAANIIPDHAELVIDIRFWDNAAYDSIKSQLESMAKQSFTPDIGVTLTQMSYKPAMVATEKTQELMDMVSQAGQELGIEIKYLEVGGGSDANLTAYYGVPSLDGLGPAGAKFHTPEEFLDCNTIEERITLLKKTLEKIAKKING